MLAPVAASVSLGERVLGVLPGTLVHGTLFGVTYWQWIALAALILAGFVFDTLIRGVGRPVMRRLARRADPEADMDNVARVAAGLGLFGAAVFWTVSVRLLGLGGVVQEFLRAAIGIFTVFAGARFGWRLTDLLGGILMRKARSTHNRIDDILVPLLRKTAKVFIVAMGIVYGAQTLNINILPLVTGLGIGGLAFAFAAKDTIENFFGSVTVILDHPFEVGDWVVVDDVEGTVEELGLRSTRIRTFYNSQVTVPNATLVRAKVDNLGRRVYRRWKTTLGVQYDTSPEKLLAFTEGIRELIRAHPFTRKDFYQVWCNDFGEFSLNVLVYTFFEVPDWSTELRERERLFVDIVRLADRLGVQFAFPTQTVHLYSEEHAVPESHYEVPKGAHDERAQLAGIEAAQAITGDRDWQKEPPPPVDFMVTHTLDRGKDRERGGS